MPLPRFLKRMNKTTLTFCAAASLLALGFLWEQVQATRLGYRVGKARLELRRERDRTAYLRLELVRLESPERLAETARKRLGMSAPEPERLIYLGNTVERPRRLASADSVYSPKLAALFGAAARRRPPAAR